MYHDGVFRGCIICPDRDAVWAIAHEKTVCTVVLHLNCTKVNIFCFSDRVRNDEILNLYMSHDGRGLCHLFNGL